MPAKFVALITSFTALLLVPAIAVGTITELGVTSHGTTNQPTTVNGQTQWQTEQPSPSCPANPCLAVSRTTGFQVKVGTDKGLFVVPHDGSIVAWSITLGKPGKKQTAFFNANEGGAPSAGIAVLRTGRSLQYRLIAQSPIVQLQPYYGTTAQFPLAQSIPVKKNYVIGLTVPTWAPALALGFGNDTSWRASRPKDKCTDTTTQTAQTQLQSVGHYPCLYRTARLTYSATLVYSP